MISRLLISILSVMLVNTASANIVFNAPDGCGNLAGFWTGSGSAQAGVIKCHYRGTAQVANTFDIKHLTMMVNLERIDGLCPAKQELQFEGTCENGAISLVTPNANLTGHVNDTATQADLKGTVTFHILSTPVVANVEMNMQKNN